MCDRARVTREFEIIVHNVTQYMATCMMRQPGLINQDDPASFSSLWASNHRCMNPIKKTEQLKSNNLFCPYLLIKAYGVNESMAVGMKNHADVLREQYSILVKLIQENAPPQAYLAPLEVVESNQTWFENHAPRGKRLCNAAKRDDNPSSKRVKTS